MDVRKPQYPAFAKILKNNYMSHYYHNASDQFNEVNDKSNSKSI